MHEAIKGTPWEGSKVYLGGTAATYKDMHDGSNIDLLIAGIAAATLIFVIMLIITRAVVAALVIVGTVLLSLGASFGLSVLLWQYILGKELHWMVLAMAIILLLAVGSDYNLLLISRFKEEIHAGLKTGTIRAMAGSGSVVTVCRSGIRRHHGHVRLQPAEGDGPGRHHDRAGSVVRHPDRAIVHDAVAGHLARTLVLVATTRSSTPRQHDAAAVRTASGGS